MSDHKELKPLGRKSTYTSEYCDRMIDFVRMNLPSTVDEIKSKGMMTKAKIADGLGLKKDTFFRWLREHEDFKAALDEVWHDIEKSWVDLGVMGTIGMLPHWNATTYVYLTKVVLGWQSEEKNASTVVNIQNLNHLTQIKKLSPTELEDRIEEELKKRSLESK